MEGLGKNKEGLGKDQGRTMEGPGKVQVGFKEDLEEGLEMAKGESRVIQGGRQLTFAMPTKISIYAKFYYVYIKQHYPKNPAQILLWQILDTLGFV